MDLLIRGGEPGRDGTLISVTPERANWRFVGFEAVRLAPGGSQTWRHLEREAYGLEADEPPVRALRRDRDERPVAARLAAANEKVH